MEINRIIPGEKVTGDVLKMLQNKNFASQMGRSYLIDCFLTFTYHVRVRY
jgi:hypothetical protein